MISRFRKNYSPVRNALLDLDESDLSVDDLIAIGRYIPTAEEVSMV